MERMQKLCKIICLPTYSKKTFRKFHLYWSRFGKYLFSYKEKILGLSINL